METVASDRVCAVSCAAAVAAWDIKANPTSSERRAVRMAARGATHMPRVMRCKRDDLRLKVIPAVGNVLAHGQSESWIYQARVVLFSQSRNMCQRTKV